jgi:polyisoprenoid-binding protein YceI
MRRHTRSGLIAALCLAPAVVAWTSYNTQVTLQPKSRLWIEGTSTVRSFQCQAGTVEAEIVATAPEIATLIASGEKAVESVALTVPAGKIDCRNGTMNDHMLKALKAKDHPTIAFKLSSYELAEVSGATKVTLNGTLELGGVTKDITMNATATPAEDGSLRVLGTHDLTMTEYGIKPPKLMMGTMKVHPKVKVGFDLLLKA